MNIHDVIPEEKRQEALDFVIKAAAAEEIPSFGTQRVTKDGRILDVWLTVTKLVDDTGKITSIATTERDITERKKTAKELKKYRDHLETLVEVRTKELKDAQEKLGGEG
jgi:two-component system CheB/CheR fusion protein